MPDRVFVDANVLFSASYRAASALVRLWERADAGIVSSAYAVEEAMRNAFVKPGEDGHAKRLTALVERTEVVVFEPPDGATLYIDTTVQLPDKDWPILLAAIDARCTHLLTGDASHFGELYGRRVGGVLVLRPGEYLRSRRE